MSPVASAAGTGSGGLPLRRIFRCLIEIWLLIVSGRANVSQMVVLRYIRQGRHHLAELAETRNGRPVRYPELSAGWARRPDHAPAGPSCLRIYRLRITAKAEAILGKTYRTYNDHLGCILAHFSPREIEVLLTSLRRLWQAVQQEQPGRN